MDLREALGSAIQHEQKARDHYADCARRTQDPMGQRVFLALAQEEQNHLDYLESLQETWKATGLLPAGELPSGLPSPGWLSAAADQVAASALPPTGGAGDPKRPELAYLKAALVLERCTTVFYRELAARVESPHRDLFTRFLEIEEGHVSLICAEIDALAGHGHWFDFMTGF